MLTEHPQQEVPMQTDQFEMRVAKVRHRFASTLENKIEIAMVSADRLSRNDGSAMKHVSDSYRHLHSIYGVGAATGEAAHVAEAALFQAFQQKRALTEAEVLRLKTALARLRDVAALELRLMCHRGG
jgi:hypothetical protein